MRKYDRDFECDETKEEKMQYICSQCLKDGILSNNGTPYCQVCNTLTDEAPHDYVTKDSGERIEWATGSRRDTNEGKPRYDLIGRTGWLAYMRFVKHRGYGVEGQSEAEVLEALVYVPEHLNLTTMPFNSVLMPIVDDVLRIMEGSDMLLTCIPVKALKRVADLMARGAVKYGEHNWAEGQPISRSYESALRHYMQYLEGDTEEDHLAAVMFNLFNMHHVLDGWTEGRFEDDMIVLE